MRVFVDTNIFLDLILKVVGANNEVVDQALGIDNIDLGDNFQYVLAQKHSCDLIVSNDRGFYSEATSVLSCSELVRKYIS